MSVAAPARWEVLYAEAYAERFRYLAGAGASFSRVHGALAVQTGSPSNTDNGIMLEREDADVAALLRWLEAPASLICSGFDASDGLRRRLAGLGLHEETTGVTSGAELVELPDAVPPNGITITQAVTERDLEDWLRVARETELFGDDERGLLPVRHWVARRGDEPVGLASAFFLAGVVLLEHVAVVEKERRRGLATALALVRLHEARRFGCRFAVFGTTPESEGVYAPFGFTTQPVEGRRWFYLP